MKETTATRPDVWIVVGGLGAGLFTGGPRLDVLLVLLLQEGGACSTYTAVKVQGHLFADAAGDGRDGGRGVGGRVKVSEMGRGPGGWRGGGERGHGGAPDDGLGVAPAGLPQALLALRLAAAALVLETKGRCGFPIGPWG